MIGGAAVRRPRPISIFGGDVPTVLYSDPARGGDGTVRINPDKSTVQWRWISASVNGITPFALPSGATLKASLTVPTTGGSDEGDFETAVLMSRAITGAGATGRIAIQPRVNSPTINRILANDVICHNLIAGTSQLPGVLPQAIYSLPKTSWDFVTENLAGADLNVQLALHGRQFTGCSPCADPVYRARAEHLRWFHPYWIGPQDASQADYTGPEVTLAANRSTNITFPIPSDADFLMLALLDDSTSAGGGEPSLYAQVTENATSRGLVDLPNTNVGASSLGISWRDFMAIPTVSVTGFPGGVVRAWSFAPNNGGIAHLVPRNTQIIIRFTSTEANAITLRVAIFGILVYGRQPEDRTTSMDGRGNRERVEQGEEFLRRMGLTSAFKQGGPQ